MFGDIFGNLQKQQEEMQQKLAAISVETESGDGAITVQATCDMQIKNIRLDPAKINPTDTEALEDLLVVALNRVLDLARQRAAVETHKLLGNMMPPGMLGDLMRGG